MLLWGSIGGLRIALEEGRHGWTQNHVIVLLAVALVALVVFVKVEQRASEPMIPLRLFANPVVLATSMLGLCAGVISFGAGQFLNLYFQDSQLISPTESGLRTIPQMIGVTAATFGVGRLIAKSGRYKRYPIVGCSLAVLGLLVISRVDGSTPYWTLIVPMAFLGFGSASVFTSTSIAGQNAVEFHDMGVTTAFMMFFRNFGGSFGLAIFGTILNSTIRSEIPARTGIPADEAASLIRSPKEIALLPLPQRDAVVDSVALGVGRIYLVCAAVMVIAVVIAILLPEKPLRMRAGLSDAMEEEKAKA